MKFIRSSLDRRCVKRKNPPVNVGFPYGAEPIAPSFVRLCQIGDDAYQRLQSSSLNYTRANRIVIARFIHKRASCGSLATLRAAAMSGAVEIIYFVLFNCYTR